MTIGVSSDTHGRLRPQAIEVLRGCELILHAGDVGHKAVFDELQRIAPLVAVRGNVDVAAGARRLPASELAEAGKKTFYILHRIADLDLKPSAAGVDAVIFGHSHIPALRAAGGGVYANPGAWMDAQTFLVVRPDRVELRRWSGSAEGDLLDVVDRGAEKPLSLA